MHLAYPGGGASELWSAARAFCRSSSMLFVSGWEPPSPRRAIRSVSSSVVTASRIVHRDLKPDNIGINGAGRVKLLVPRRRPLEVFYTFDRLAQRQDLAARARRAARDGVPYRHAVTSIESNECTPLLLLENTMIILLCIHPMKSRIS